MPDARERLIVALDTPNAAAAHQIVAAVGEMAQTYKVGKQLFTAEGPRVVRDLVASGRDVFLDLKFHDIPNTVAAAVHQAAALRVRMLTVHASGGLKMLQAAVDAAAEFTPAVAPPQAEPGLVRQGGDFPRDKPARPLVLAVTVLTSLSDDDLQQIGVSGRVLDHALRLAALARTAGCDGIVCSAREVRELRRELGAGFAIVTPGIRPVGVLQNDDQQRAATPAAAIAAGASHIVVGRPITAAPDPSAAARAILDEIASACH